MPLEAYIDIMRDSLTSILADNNPTVYLFGSVVTGDFRSGWSDIDILCLCEKQLSEGQMDKLLTLRQTLREAHNDPAYRLFEGGILTWDAFLAKASGLAVYWGTSGQRITDSYHFDPFSVLSLKKHGRLLAGADHRDAIEMPNRESLLSAVRQVHETIRKYAKETDESLYSVGWMLDIARCLYTLDTGDIIAKTAAGHWALQKGLVPDVEIMQKALALREEPVRADAAAKEWLCGLGPYVQRFADVLEQRLSTPYDALAQTWDDNRRIERANVIAQEIKRHIPRHRKTAMEFGCGTGLISFCLRDLFEEITLIDTSEGMIDVLREKIRAADAKNMLPLKMDLTKELYQEKKFDVIFSSMVLHHIADTHAIVEKLHGMLQENGCVCIVDMDRDDGLFHQEEPGFDGHNGFDQGELREVFRQQGFQNLRGETFYHGVKMRGDTPMPYSLFCLCAEK